MGPGQAGPEQAGPEQAGRDAAGSSGHEGNAGVDAGFTGKITRVNSEDSFIPLGDAAQAVLLSAAAIESGARSLLPR
jgi:2-oxoisovalerate dehydrogenase E1 component